MVGHLVRIDIIRVGFGNRIPRNNGNLCHIPLHNLTMKHPPELHSRGRLLNPYSIRSLRCTAHRATVHCSLEVFKAL